MTIRFAVAAAFALAGTAAVYAQATAGAQTTFRSGVDLVRLDVRVVDSAGKPVRDLRADEIEIHEDGTTLPVLLFQRISEATDSYVEEAVRAVTAEVSSNDAFPRGHLYILIFDQQHITPGNEQRARLAAEQFIRRRVRPSDRVALFAVPGPGPQIGFTSEKTRLISELSKVRGSFQRVVSTAMGTMSLFEAHRIVQGDERVVIDALARMNRETGADVLGFRTDGRATSVASTMAESSATGAPLLRENARQIVAQSDGETRQFLQRLADVIVNFREIEGRKTVVLFSEGFYQDNLARELEDVAAAAAQSSCTFYSFDLNQRTQAISEGQPSETALGSEIQARIAPMATLALETDGALVLDAANRTEEALNMLADQAQHYYLVGFTPSDAARQKRGTYRRVTVKVKRPGARVIARTGYALAPETTVTDRRRAIDSVLSAPFVQQGLKINYTTYVMKAPAPGQQRVVLSLNADLPVRSKPGDSADVVFVARDVRDGRVVASGTDTMPLPAAPRPGASLGTSTWRVQFTAPAGSYLMRTVVREPGGLVGSADRRIDVRPLDAPDVAVSDLILGSALAALPVRAQAFTGDGLAGVIEAYGRTQEQLEGLQVRIELRRPDNGDSVATFNADTQAAEPDGTGVSRRAPFLLPLERIPPGEYIAHAVVRADGEVVAERTRHVEVLEGYATRPAADAPTGSTGIVSPLEIVKGDLAGKYIASLRQRAQGTPAARAAQRAAEGQWEHVEAELARAGEENPAATNGLLGLALFVREDYAAAAAALKAAFAADRTNALAAFFLGWAWQGAGDMRAAIGAWRSAAHLDPSLVSVHLALAEGYLKISQPALAVQALRAGLAALPSSPELQARLDQIVRKDN